MTPALVTPAHANNAFFPTHFSLPEGFPPEGITISEWSPTAYFGSRLDGSIFQVNLVNGHGSILSVGPGTSSVGIKVDFRNRLFVAGGAAGDARVIDARDGDVLKSYQLGTGSTFINDEVITLDAVWFTDSLTPVLYKLPLGRHGALPEQDQIVRLPLSGDLVFGAGFNSNGIVTSPDGRSLLVVQTNTGELFRVDPDTGVTRTVDLGGELLTAGDGLLRLGHTLFAVQNELNQVAKVELDSEGSRGRVIMRVTDPRLDTPTTVAAFGDRLYLPNARLNAPSTPTTTYDVMAIERP